MTTQYLLLLLEPNNQSVYPDPEEIPVAHIQVSNPYILEILGK